jgi:hypothetical protein
MLRVLFLGIFLLSCIIETQDALFTDGRSIQEVIKFFFFKEKIKLFFKF